MAWTTPRDWSTGEFVNEAMMDTHIRDNFLAMGPHLIVRKPSDESVTSSTTFQADDHLLMAVAANEVWLTRWVVVWTGSTTGDINTRFTFPAGGELTLSALRSDGTGTQTPFMFGYTTSPTAAISSESLASGGLRTFIIFDIQFTNSGTAGNVALEWAQLSSNGTATIVKANSTLWGVKLA